MWPEKTGYQSEVAQSQQAICKMLVVLNLKEIFPNVKDPFIDLFHHCWRSSSKKNLNFSTASIKLYNIGNNRAKHIGAKQSNLFKRKKKSEN